MLAKVIARCVAATMAGLSAGLAALQHPHDALQCRPTSHTIKVPLHDDYSVKAREPAAKRERPLLLPACTAKLIARCCLIRFERMLSGSQSCWAMLRR